LEKYLWKDLTNAVMLMPFSAMTLLT
jgi:hypothetical protein